MKKFKVNSGLIIFLVVLIILFIPIIVDYINSRKIEVIDETKLTELMSVDTNTFILYVGDVDKKLAKELREIRDKKGTEYSYQYNVYSIVDSKYVDEMFGKETKVAVVIEGDIQKTYEEYKFSTLSSYSNIYLSGNITNSNRAYKVAENYNEYKKLVKSDDVVMAIFGYSECYHCNVFKPIYNAVAEKYDVDIYYFESDTYDKDEYTKIVNMDLTVPAKCSGTGKEFMLSDGFGTPLTIFTKKGKVIDCIGGRVSRSKLLEKLVSLEMISE